ncbi:unnamed protein product [Thelazia callipaeda]|uniref:Secreted protein n=1 Tax=Thelazia callipaeda TaxID=103827 RepID=A0A0N5D0E5_THECL|nr:unnamed protein product [Thelazia callipaeda]
MLTVTFLSLNVAAELMVIGKTGKHDLDTTRSSFDPFFKKRLTFSDLMKLVLSKPSFQVYPPFTNLDRSTRTIRGTNVGQRSLGDAMASDFHNCFLSPVQCMLPINNMF